MNLLFHINEMVLNIMCHASLIISCCFCKVIDCILLVANIKSKLNVFHYISSDLFTRCL